MKIKITTIAENTVATSKEQIGEHGLSFLIEAGDKKILFDTGQGFALAHNAPRMGIDLKSVSTVVLSHGHYDHAGGLNALINAGAEFELIAHPDIFEEKLAMHPAMGFIPIGLPLKKKFLEEKGIRLNLTKESVEVAPGIVTTGEVRMKNDFEKIEPMLFVRRDGKEMPDPLADDQALVISAAQGTVLLLGCAHRGLVNTLDRAAELTGGRPVHAIIGGMHLERASDAQIASTIEELQKIELKVISPAHCTGIRAQARLIQEFGNRVVQATVGNNFQFDIA